MDPKEQKKLDKLVNGEGLIKREEFIEFSKKSQAVKELGLRGSRSSTPVRKAEIDKAEVVFRVNIDLAINTFCYVKPASQVKPTF